MRESFRKRAYSIIEAIARNFHSYFALAFCVACNTFLAEAKSNFSDRILSGRSEPYPIIDYLTENHESITKSLFVTLLCTTALYTEARREDSEYVRYFARQTHLFVCKCTYSLTAAAFIFSIITRYKVSLFIETCSLTYTETNHNIATEPFTILALALTALLITFPTERAYSKIVQQISGGYCAAFGLLFPTIVEEYRSALSYLSCMSISIEGSKPLSPDGILTERASSIVEQYWLLLPLTSVIAVFFVATSVTPVLRRVGASVLGAGGGVESCGDDECP